MTINSYLNRVAFAAVLRDKERESIQRSIATLKTRLLLDFQGSIREQLVFGSHSRGTILPRSLDPQSDVDYMVVFNDENLRPQSYLDRLSRFAQRRYSSSEIGLANPTVVLELDHIRFELVPALKDWLENYKIPAKASSYQDWIDTNPKNFNDKLTAANGSCGSLVKPLIRVMKYWNACAKYPFESYELEQKIVGHGFGFFGLLGGGNIGTMFSEFVSGLGLGIFSPQWKQSALARLKETAEEARQLERRGNELAAEQQIAKLVPLSS